MDQTYYLISPSRLGEFGIIWQMRIDQPRILRLTLPGSQPRLEPALKVYFPGAVKGSQPTMEVLAGDIRRYLDGGEVDFDLQWLAWEVCSDFQAGVLRAEFGIPQGWVSTYGRIADHLGLPGGGRAVGNALAANPFPLLIPCHRAVRSTGELGGYQGGLEMKKALLEMEGVAFLSPTKVSLDRVYY